jgi:hypothetical protein
MRTNVRKHANKIADAKEKKKKLDCFYCILTVKIFDHLQITLE